VRHDAQFVALRRRRQHDEGTHRFCVLHDMGSTPSRESPPVEHFDLEEIRTEVVETLRIDRSAILSLRDAIMVREA
jgi:hypothetical protein